MAAGEEPDTARSSISSLGNERLSFSAGPEDWPSSARSAKADHVKFAEAGGGLGQQLADADSPPKQAWGKPMCGTHACTIGG